MTSVSERLEALSGLQASELRTQWQKCFGVAAPKHISRDLLVRAIAFHIQEKAYGYGGKQLDRRIADLAARHTADGKTSADVALGPGVRLVRDWGGQTHIVVVADDMLFEYRGRRYQSLTQIARQITGTHRSGPGFFGLKRARVPDKGGIDSTDLSDG